LKNKQWNEAESEIKRLKEVDNSNTEVHLLLGTLYLNKQQFEQARLEFETYLKLAPNSPNAATVRRQIDRLPNPPVSTRKG
jgi:Flp pilus assembly protein TadD